MALSEAGLSQLFLQKLDSIKAGGFQAADCPRVTGGLDVPFFSESLLACLPAFSVLCYYHLSSNHHGCAGGTSQSGNPDLEERNSGESSLSQGSIPVPFSSWSYKHGCQGPVPVEKWERSQRPEHACSQKCRLKKVEKAGKK